MIDNKFRKKTTTFLKKRPELKEASRKKIVKGSIKLGKNSNSSLASYRPNLLLCLP